MHRESQLRGRDRLAALKAHSEMTDDKMGLQRHRFAKLADPANAARAVSSFNLFQTPEPLAARVAELLGPRRRVLEPSVGLGRLWRAYGPRCEWVLVEKDAEICGELYRMIEGHNARLIQGDFLEQSPESLGMFDGVLMNPPFKMGTDIKHIQHARRFLSAGGVLVSLCAAGPRQRAAMEFDADQWIDLPAGSFKESFTNVNAAIVIYRH